MALWHHSILAEDLEFWADGVLPRKSWRIEQNTESDEMAEHGYRRSSRFASQGMFYLDSAFFQSVYNPLATHYDYSVATIVQNA